MIDAEVKSFLKGEFKVECGVIELKRGEPFPFSLVGPGIITQDSKKILNFRIHVDSKTSRSALNDLNRDRDVGKLISKNEYFQFTAYTYGSRVWRSTVVAIGCTLDLGRGGMVFGELEEIYESREIFPEELYKDFAHLYIREKKQFPVTGFTESEIKRQGKICGTQMSRDHARFETKTESFELIKNEIGVELICVFEKGGISKNRHIRIQEALQFSMGQQFNPCILILRRGKTLTEIFRSISFRDNMIRQKPPLLFEGKHLRCEVFEIAKAFYAKICDHEDEKWHSISVPIYYLFHAASAVLEIQSLVFTVAAESIAKFCCRDIVDVNLSFQNEIDDAIKYINKLKLSREVINRIIGAVGSMRKIRGSDCIRAFLEKNGLDNSILESWKRIRNPAAHGDALYLEKNDSLLHDLDNVLYLSYAMILDFIGYKGLRTNYSRDAYPDETINL